MIDSWASLAASHASISSAHAWVKRFAALVEVNSVVKQLWKKHWWFVRLQRRMSDQDKQISSLWLTFLADIDYILGNNGLFYYNGTLSIRKALKDTVELFTTVVCWMKNAKGFAFWRHKRSIEIIQVGQLLWIYRTVRDFSITPVLSSVPDVIAAKREGDRVNLKRWVGYNWIIHVL